MGDCVDSAVWKLKHLNSFEYIQDPFTAISGEDFGDNKGRSSPRFLVSVESSEPSLQLLEETSSLTVCFATSAVSDGPFSGFGVTEFWFTLGGTFSVACLLLDSPPSFKVEQKTALGFKPFGESCNLFASLSSFGTNLRFNGNSTSPPSSSDEPVVFFGGGL